MTDPTRKDARIPIIGEAMPSVDGDEPYIHDVTARALGVEVRNTLDLAALCGDDKVFCDLCGAEFPLWPVRLWAKHYTSTHAGEVTDQQHDSIVQFCTNDMTPAVRQWFGLQLMIRQSIRRRARDLGLLRFGEESKIDA
jgi:hypothetical protein